MARVNPVMQHAKPAKPVKSKEQVAIEDFMNSIPPEVVVENGAIIDNTIPEEMVVEDTSLDPIVDSVVAADQLDELAQDVDCITTAASMESYTRIFRQMTEATGHPVASLESYPATKGGVKRLAKAIRSHASEIRNCVNFAFEDYTDKVDESVNTTYANFKQAIGKLQQTKALMTKSGDFVLVNQKEGWQLFHIRGQLMDLSQFKEEIRGVESLTQLAHEGVEKIYQMASGKGEGVALKKFLNVNLMNNTTVKVKDGRAHFEEVAAPKPTREWTSKDWYKHLAYSLLNKDYKDGNGEEQTVVIESKKALNKVIDELKKFGPIMQDLVKDSDELVKVIREHDESKRKELQRAASPVLELIDKTLKHVTEVTYGVMKMTDRMGK